MKPLRLAGLFGSLLIVINHSLANETAATITQASVKITHSMSATAPGQSASAGTALHSGEFVRTGKASLAELVLDNKTVTRMGPNTVLSYTAATHATTLQSGTILFSKPKDGQAMTIQMPGLTAAVTGTTGFVERDDKGVLFGVIEGTVHVTVGSATAVLKAGKMLIAIGSRAQVVSFDVPDFVATSAFFLRFSGALPNDKSVQHEIAQYDNLVSRGFIAPVKVALATGDHHEGEVASRAGHESASQVSTVSNGAVALAGGSSSAGITLNGSSSASLAKAGSSGMSLSGAGTITTGANSYTGTTAVTSGALAVNGNVNTTGTLALGGATTSGALTLNSVNTGGSSITGGTLNNYGAGATLSAANGSGSNGATLTGVTTILTGNPTVTGGLGGGTASLNFGGGSITLANNSGTAFNLGSGILNLNGGTVTFNTGNINAGSVTGVSNGTLVNNTGSSLTIGGVIVPAHGTVTVH